MMGRATALTIAVAAVLGLGWWVSGLLLLSPTPFEISVSPASPRAGEFATLRIVPVAGRTMQGSSGALYDLFIVKLMTTRAPYLTPEAVWSPVPTPYRRGISLGATSFIDQPWRVEPAGWFSVALLTVEAGQHPAARANWRFRPSQLWLMVKPLRAAGERHLAERIAVVGGLAVLAALVTTWLFADAARSRRREERVGP